jgi:GNAT superfamily N-acetyltransferase
VAGLPESALRLAEDPDTLGIDPQPVARRFLTPSFTLVLFPIQSVVSHVRTSEAELDGTIAEVRRLVRDAGFRKIVWAVGPSARPPGLRALLAQRGFVPATTTGLEATMTAMALAQPPPPAPPHVETRLASTLDDYLEAVRIAMTTFSASDQETAEWLAVAPAMWAQQDGIQRLAYLALIDGKPVGFAFAVGTPLGMILGGSGVLPEARRRGAYRALVRARWDRAVELGTPVLVVHAGAMSRPILERCGFESVCQLDFLEHPNPLGAPS